MRVDPHQHFWHYDPQRDRWITGAMAVLQRDFLPQHLLPELAANGLDGGVAVQADQSESETGFLLDLAERDDRFMLRQDFLRGLSHLREFDFTYDLLIYPRQLPAAVELLSRLPEQRFVIDHMAKPAIKDKGFEREDLQAGELELHGQCPVR